MVESLLYTCPCVLSVHLYYHVHCSLSQLTHLWENTAITKQIITAVVIKTMTVKVTIYIRTISQRDFS